MLDAGFEEPGAKCGMNTRPGGKGEEPTACTWIASQICTSPLLVPTDKKVPRWLHETLQTVFWGLPAELAQLGDLGGAGRPEVHAGAQPDRQHILTGPVHQVEVEVVRQLRGIKHLRQRQSQSKSRRGQMSLPAERLLPGHRLLVLQ